MLSFNRLFHFMIKPGSIFTYGLLCTLVFLYMDKPLAEILYAQDVSTRYIFISWLTHLGLFALYSSLFFAAALWFRYVKKNALNEARCWFLWLCVLFNGSLCVVLKIFLGRARPELWFEHGFYGFYGFEYHSVFWSLPSGHTTTVMTVAFGLSVLFPRFRSLFILTGLSVALSRVLLVHHYLSDIMAAVYLSLTGTGFLLWVLQKNTRLNTFFKTSELIQKEKEEQACSICST